MQGGQRTLILLVALILLCKQFINCSLLLKSVPRIATVIMTYKHLLSSYN